MPAGRESNTSLHDELQQQLDARPDKFTLAWWNEQFGEVLKGYRGATHGINRCLAEYAECATAVEELRQRCSALETERESANAAIGQLQSELKTLRERMDKASEFIRAHVRKENGGAT